MIIGIIIWFAKVFLYFRGPTNCVEWLIYLHEKNHGKSPKMDMIKRNPGPLITIGFMLYMVIGPISALDFIGVIRSVDAANNPKK